MRLIDASKLEPKRLFLVSGKRNRVPVYGYTKEEINDAPTVEIEPEVIIKYEDREMNVGEWIKQPSVLGDCVYTCPFCRSSWLNYGNKYNDGPHPTFSYCAHCGARLNGYEEAKD